MASLPTIEDALHGYLDSIEDLTLDAIQRLVSRLASLPASAWLGLSRAETRAALTARLGAAIAADLLPELDQIAIDTTTKVGAITQAKAGRAVRELARSPEAGASDLLPARARALAIRRIQSGVDSVLSGPLTQIRKLVEDSRVTSRAGASALIERIRSEVVAPLREREPTGAEIAAMSRAVSGVGQDVLAFADIRLAEPDLTPEQAEAAAADAPLRWVATLVNTCPDCLPRHGQIDRYESWAGRGTPRDGWSVCGERCKCLLIPGLSNDHSSLVTPLRREAMGAAREGTKKGLTVRVPTQLLEEESTRTLSKAEREERLRAAYADDIRVRRAMRDLGRSNS